MDPLIIAEPIIVLFSVLFGFCLARIKARSDHRMRMEEIAAQREDLHLAS